MFPNEQTSNPQVDVNSETSSVHTHTAKTADEKRNSVSFASHTPSNDERLMQLRQIQSDDKTQFRVRLHHLANRYVLKRETLGPTLGLSQTGSQNQGSPNDPTEEERSIERTLSMEGKARTAARICTNAHKIPGSCSENRHWFFKLSPASNVSSLSITTSIEKINCGLGSFTSCDE